MQLDGIVQLRRGRSECDLAPAIGGAIARWAVAGQDMLRRASPEAITAGDPLALASFPLVPYSNRIGHARFEWNGETIHLAHNHPPEPHALHGVGWHRVWTVTAQAADTATLRLVHTPDGNWPWPFEAVQHVALSEHGLEVTLIVTNHAALAVPLAFGHHPYFDLAGASLRFAAKRVWLTGCDQLPTQAVAPIGKFDFDRDTHVPGRVIDNCYAGVDGAATIEWIDRPLRLEIRTSPSMPAAVVYVPQDGDAFCFEPVPHINNALNLPSERPAMPVLAPGATMETSLHFQVFDK